MIILDTHIWHWWINQIPNKLSPEIRSLIENSERLAISAISCFEMAWLVKHGRIDLSMSFNDWFQQIEAAHIIEFLPVTPYIASNAVNLPQHHKDPMDRIIISTTLHYNAQLISFDSAFPSYCDTGLQLITKR